MPLPTITILGNLTEDPILRYTQSGKGVANLRVAANERRKDEQGNWVDGESTFLDVTSWRNPEAIRDQLKKGSRVVVIGTLRQRNYETKDGEKRTQLYVLADEVALQIYDKAGNFAGSQSVTHPDPWSGSEPNPTDETPF